MGTRQSGSLLGRHHDDITVTEAAIRTCGRLLAAMTCRIKTYAYHDGGLICEDRSSPARPRMWRVAADGALLPDSSYSFARREFVSVPAPAISVRLSNRIRGPRSETNWREKVYEYQHARSF
jgi:hypothetical protein